MAQLRAKVQPLHIACGAVRKAGQRRRDGGIRRSNTDRPKAIHLRRSPRLDRVYSTLLANSSVCPMRYNLTSRHSFSVGFIAKNTDPTVKYQVAV